MQVNHYNNLYVNNFAICLTAVIAGRLDGLAPLHIEVLKNAKIWSPHLLSW